MRFNTKTFLFILVIFLLGTNIAVVATYMAHKRAETSESVRKMVIPDTQFGRFFKDELNLNAEQHESFREFRRGYNRSANKVMAEMQDLRAEMASVLKSSHPNRKTLDNLARKLGEKHHELKGLTFDYYFNMQSVLDEDQQEKMVDIFQAMLTEDGNAKTPGQGHSGEGRGQGQGHRQGQGMNKLDTLPEIN